MIQITKTEKQIEQQLQKAEDASINGTKYSGMTYEEGMLALYNWLTGETDDLPLEED